MAHSLKDRAEHPADPAATFGPFVKAADALGDRQFGRVSRAASLFIAHHPRYAACSVRFDAVLVGGVWPRHLPDVWQAPE